MQRDAMDRLGLRQLLIEPEMLQAVEPDVSLVATLVALNRVAQDGMRVRASAGADSPIVPASLIPNSEN